jgi:hypothetical protein
MVNLAAQSEHRGQAALASTGPVQTTQVRGAIHDSMISFEIDILARSLDIPASIPEIPAGVLRRH